MKALSSFFSAVGGGCRALGRMRTSWGESLSADLRSLPLLRALSQLFSVALTHLKLGQAPSQDLLLSKTPKSSTPLPALSSPLSPQPFHPFVFFFFFPFLFFSFPSLSLTSSTCHRAHSSALSSPLRYSQREGFFNIWVSNNCYFNSI